MESLIDLDIRFTLWVNSLHHPILDSILIFWSRKWVWLPLYALLVGGFVRRAGWKMSLVWVLALAAAVAASDQTCSAFLKPLTERLRPCHNPDLSGHLYLPDGCGGRYGFASSHAANSFCLAVFCFLIGFPGRYLRVALFAWALVMGWSRIYLGAHFLGDVAAGFAIGAFWAFGAVRLAHAIGRTGFVRPKAG